VGLYVAQVPYSQDVRQYHFVSLDLIKGTDGTMIPNKRMQPKEKHLHAMGDLIDAMDLTVHEEADELFAPENLYEPRRQTVYDAIMNRALLPDAPVPERDPRLVHQLDVPAHIQDAVARMSDRLRALFPIAKSSICHDVLTITS
jgi:ATP-dependent DNA helicase 2 subunit 2